MTGYRDSKRSEGERIAQNLKSCVNSVCHGKK